MKDKYVYTAHVPAGKHSIFVYDVLSNKFYYKIIVVNVKSAIDAQKYWLEEFVPVEPIKTSNAPK